jgi:lantibiotic modifying enzyme
MGQEVPQAVTDWILARNKHPELYSPGLFVGMAGIAWGMLDLGLKDEAADMMVSTFDHRLLYDSHDLYFGISGWGLANLRFFAELHDQRFLEKATMADDEKGIQLGYHFGGSGMSLFLLYLYKATQKEVFLEVGKKLLDFDLNNASKSIDGGISWKKIMDQGRIVYPYLGQGSAGVGKAVARYLDFTGEERYSEFLEQIVADANRKYTVFPGLTNGITGLGDFLIDAYQVTGKEAHLKAAYRAASGLLLFKMERDEGIAFPGDGLTRISCDYSTGSAGIGSFLHRLANTAERSDFLLDGYFEQDTRAAVTTAA